MNTTHPLGFAATSAFIFTLATFEPLNEDFNCTCLTTELASNTKS